MSLRVLYRGIRGVFDYGNIDTEPEALAGKKSVKSPRKNIREAVNMRVRPEVRRLIDRAAELTGKNRTDFILEAAQRAAQNALLDQALVTLDPKSYEAFVALLGAPPKPNERLLKTLHTPPPWK